MAIPHTMQAMLLERPGERLRAASLPVPTPGPGQVLLRVLACGVCRTDLHIVDGELTEPALPLIPGHQIVGVVEALGQGVVSRAKGAGEGAAARREREGEGAAARGEGEGEGVAARGEGEEEGAAACGQGEEEEGAAAHAIGDRVGVPWLGGTCGGCRYCTSDRENLCDRATFTGYQIPGGFAEYTVADARFCFALPEGYSALGAAPLLCAGLIGYRALSMAGAAGRVGFYGFGSAAHLLARVAVHQGRRVFAFTRPGDVEGQDFARSLGAAWAGGSFDAPPEPLEAAIIFAPVGALVPAALKAVEPGGVVICAGIHMSDIPALPYKLLWQERAIRSVANLTRRDGHEFLALAAQVHLQAEVTPYRLEQANVALDDLRAGRIQGSAVLHVVP